jgi:hypothetical protein
MGKEKKGMAKWLKATLISVGSLVGLVVIVAAVALWLVFTPSKLTGIVNKLAGKFVTCETHFGRVNLTIFKTFPDAGLTIDDVYVVNPMVGAPSDTVAVIGNLTVGVDLKKYLKEKEVVVHQVLLDNVVANLYIDTAGKGNFDIFPHSDDNEDTTESSFNLDSLPNIDLRKIKISDLNARLCNEKGRMDAIVEDLDLGIVGKLSEGKVDADLKLEIAGGDLMIVDSTGNPKMDAALYGLTLDLDAEGNLDEVAGKLEVELEKGLYNDMINEHLQASKKDLLRLKMPFTADLQRMQFALDETWLSLAGYELKLDGRVAMARDGEPMKVDMKVHNTFDPWQVEPLLELVPEQFMGWKKGMDVDGEVALAATVVGDLGNDRMPLVNASATIGNGRFYLSKSLPYKISKINADLEASLDLSKGGKSSAVVNSFKAHTRGTDVSISGRADDLTGDMHIDAKVKGKLPLEDIQPLLPDSLHLTAQGNADIDVSANFRMSQLKAKAYDKMVAAATIGLKKVDVTYDSIHAVAPDLDIALQLPAKEHKGKMAEARIKGSRLNVEMGNITAGIETPDINVGVNNLTKEQIAAAFDIAIGEGNAEIDSMTVAFGSLSLGGSVRLDSTQENVLRKYNPVADIAMYNAIVYTPQLPDAVRLSQLVVDYKPELCDIKAAEVKVGHSDMQLYGTVENLEKWMSHEAMLKGDLNLVSSYADVDELMNMLSGMGSDKDTIEQMREEDNVPKEANPFIVPKDVDVTLHTHIKRSVAFGNDLSDVAGSLTINDGVAVLDQMGFVCKAASMQLTALYKSPRPNNLFVSLDFHLLDIQIDELLDMIPTVDTLVPMLAAFNGNANFHLAGETFLNAKYQPKMSSLLGSAAISGKDLVVMDNSSIAQIAKLMRFKDWKDKDNKIKIDSLSVEMTCLRKEIEVFPFLLNIGKYQLCASGKHTLDNECGYHVELLKNPIMAKVGVDVNGTLKSPKISLGEVRYADLYKPEKQGVVEKQTLRLKNMIREALEANVR